MVSPTPEEPVLEPDLDREEFDIRSMIETVKPRASAGARLKAVKIVDRNVDSGLRPGADLFHPRLKGQLVPISLDPTILFSAFSVTLHVLQTEHFRVL